MESIDWLLGLGTILCNAVGVWNDYSKSLQEFNTSSFVIIAKIAVGTCSEGNFQKKSNNVDNSLANNFIRVFIRIY